MTSTQHTHALPGPDDVLRVELDNGITVLARENFTSPAVVVDGLIPDHCQEGDRVHLTDRDREGVRGAEGW